MTVYLTPEEAAGKLPVGNAAWIRMQLRAGRLRGSKVGGGRWVVEESAIDEMVAAGSNSTTRRRRQRANGGA